MWGLIGILALLALGVAISVAPITAVIVILSARRGLVKSILLVLGWVLAMAVIGAVVLIAFAGADYSRGSSNRTATDYIHLALGVLLLLLGLISLFRKPPAGGARSMDEWMSKVDRLSPATTFALGFALIALSPKRLALSLAAVTEILQADLGVLPSMVSMAVFIMVASITVAVPVVIYSVAPAWSSPFLDSCKSWLSRHNRVITIGSLTVLGVFLIAKGTIGLVW